MYITCQKCDTVFRLDDRLLQPTGSKVRCSQCGNVFTAVPPAPAETEPDPALETMFWSGQPSAGRSEEPTLPRDSSLEVRSESADLPLDLDFDAELDLDILTAEPAEPEAVPEILEELDLDSDFSLDIEESAPAAAPAPEPHDEPLMDLDLEGLFIEAGGPISTASENPPVDDSLSEDFSAALRHFDHPDQPLDDSVTMFVDMSDNAEEPVDMDNLDLELELELDETPAVEDAMKAETGADIDLGPDPEEELQLDPGEAGTPLTGEIIFTPEEDLEGEVDELNFSDLESILESEDDNLASADGPEEELSLDLFDNDGPVAAPEENAEPEEFTLELDTAYKEKHLEPKEPAPPAESTEAVTEIDLSDLELMLEGDGTQPDPSQWVAGKQTEGAADGAEIDLGDLEAAIDEVETRSDSDTGGEDTMDLEFSLPVEEELELEDAAPEAIDLELQSPESTAVENGKPLRAGSLGTNDMELEFNVEDEPQPAQPAAPAAASAPAGDSEEFPIALPVLEELEELSEDVPLPPRKKSKASTMVLAIILLLALAGFGLYYAATQAGITIPFISDYLNPVEQDPAGVRHLSTPEINSKFFENTQSGRLFVISGTIRNGYPEARTNIRLQGKLYTKGKKLAKAETVYAGIMIDDQEVATGSAVEIKKRLESAPGPHDPAAKALPSQSLPFMVVFSDLPDTSQLDEFAVEPVGSTPVK